MAPPDSPGTLRPDDAAKFLEVVRYAESCPPHRRRSLRELLEGQFRPLTTTLGQLQRVADYFFGPAGPGGGSGVERLLAAPSREEGVRPTEDARALGRILRVYATFSARLRDQFREQLSPGKAPQAVVRLGCPETIGFRLLASVLSDWTGALPGVDLQMTIDNSRLLVPRLHAGLLDLVASYGPGDGLTPDATYDVTFASLGYPSRMCLLCHPADGLWLRGGENVNAGYWRKSYAAPTRVERAARRAKLEFGKLRPVRPEEVDFRKTTLIVVPSWRQPRALEESVRELRAQGCRVRTADSYDEALSLVRMRVGVAAATEVFSKRDHVTAFRLTPEESYVRWIGVYYNNRHGLSEAACQVAEFLREYRVKFEGVIRGGETPAYGDPSFGEWWSGLTRGSEWSSRDWAADSRRRYPTIGGQFRDPGEHGE